MAAIPEDLWIPMLCALFAGGLGATAWISGNRRTAAFAEALATATGGTVDGDACRIDYRGLAYRVRQVRERRHGHSSRETVVVELAASCPAWVTLSESDGVLALLRRVAGDAESAPDWRLPGYRVHSASPGWARSWLSSGSARERLQALTLESVSLLRLGPCGVECRRPLTDAESETRVPVVLALIAALHGVVTEAIEHAPEPVVAGERASDFTDSWGALRVPLGVMALSALAFLPAVGLTHGRPPLPWGLELELGGASLLAAVGLLLYRPHLRAQVAGRENPANLYLSALLMMGLGLLLTGAALSRPLAYLLG